MVSIREMTASVYGAWLLLRLDERGLTFFNATPEGFMRSFAAAGITAIPYFVLRYMELQTLPAPPPVDLDFVLVQLSVYVMLWAVFPLMMDPVSQAMKRSQFFIRFIVANNWAMVVQAAVFIPPILLAKSGILPEGPASLIGFAAAMGTIAYFGIVVNMALRAGIAGTLAIVVLGILLEITIRGYGNAILLR